jgi:predicted RNase H-like HicB family nuclease
MATMNQGAEVPYDGDFDDLVRAAKEADIAAGDAKYARIEEDGHWSADAGLEVLAEVGLTYGVTWSAEDGAFVATCAAFPSLSWLAPSENEALQGLEALLRDVRADMREHSEQVSQPPAERS